MRHPAYAYMDFESHAKRILSRFPNVKLIRKDSRTIDVLAPADLIHIDGDHSRRGCASDIELAIRSGIPWALIDDTDFIPVVCKVVREYVERLSLDVEWLHDGVRGSALLRLP
jgi:hypothetical protein